MTKINTRAWNSSSHGKQITEDQNKKGKKWFVTYSPKRVKLKWNKKNGVLEKTKKGSREYFVWAD
jgi:hypothetical protein